MTVDGTLRGRRAIVSAGAWTAQVLPQPGSVEVQGRVLLWFPNRNPAAFLPERLPGFMRDAGGEFEWYGFSTLDRATVKLAFHSHFHGEPTDPAGLDREIHPKDWELLAAEVR